MSGLDEKAGFNYLFYHFIISFYIDVYVYVNIHEETQLLQIHGVEYSYRWRTSPVEMPWCNEVNQVISVNLFKVTCFI